MRAARIVSMLAAALAVGVSGCGGDGDRGAGSGADIAPASTALYVSLRTDFDGDQWQIAARHAEKFPAAQQLLAKLEEELEREGLDWERDVRPALGAELAVAVASPEGRRDDERVVALTQPRDEAKLEELVAKGESLRYRMVDGWAVIAKSDAAIADFEAAAEGDSLAQTDAWEEATKDLPDDALVAGYVNGAALTRGVGADASDASGGEAAFRALLPGGRAPSVGFAVQAADDGVFLEARSTMDAEGVDAYAASLPEELPAAPLAYVSWNDAATHLREALARAGDADPEVDRAIAQAELALGLSLERDVLPLLEGEGALAVYPFAAPEAADPGMGWSGHPSLALVLAVEDEERALGTLDRIVERASQFLGSVERTGDVRIGALDARVVSLDGLDIFYAAWDGKLVLTTARPLLASIAGDAERLADDEAFAAAREAAAAPDETTGFAFVDFDALVEDVAGTAPPSVERNLEPLGPLFLYGAEDDERLGLRGFLRIE